MQERTKILRQAGAAKRESWLQVSRRHVQLLVAAEDLHDLAPVEAESLGDVPDLVGESDLQRVKGVAGVLDHLGNAQLGPDDRPGQTRIELRDDIAAALVQLADDGERRTVVITD